MKYLFLTGMVLFLVTASFAQTNDNTQLAQLFANYTHTQYKLFPVNATGNGDYRYNDLLPVTFTDSYRAKVRAVLNKYLRDIKKFNRASLNTNDLISYDIFKRQLEMELEGLTFKTNRMPFNQMFAFELTMGQLGSGTGDQPFKTVRDYDNWISRAKKFSAYADSDIVYMRKGIREHIVLPKALVVKIIPQMKALQKQDVTESVFYGPIKNFPATFSDEERSRLTSEFKDLIENYLNPSYKKLQDFLTDEYLDKARTTSGLSAIPNGKSIYNYYIRAYTTTNKTPEEIYNTGIAEVKRIRSEMERVKTQVNFKGTLDLFFVYTKTDPQFLPYKTAEDILIAYRTIQAKVEPHLDSLFTLRPKTPFEIRQTEAFRAASAAAQYNRGLPDGSRPGIFYVPIVDPTKYTLAKENLFIHEAIPGHHFQIMIQKENKSLPEFRQNGGNSAFSEGWALYCETLGKLMGCYTDPYQYFYSLGDEIHRAIRLVVDVGIHTKGWTREAAITYMRNNEPITEQAPTAEVERYMAIPGQALSYKIGELKINELRKRYATQLGTKFKLSAFNDEVIRDGAMPLSLLETKMNKWASKQ